MVLSDLHPAAVTLGGRRSSKTLKVVPAWFADSIIFTVTTCPRFERWGWSCVSASNLALAHPKQQCRDWRRSSPDAAAAAYVGVPGAFIWDLDRH
jgi:hypothetical protein